MIYPPFQVLILIYASFTFCLTTVLLLLNEKNSNIVSCIRMPETCTIFPFLLFLLVTFLPQIYFASLFYPSFAAGDEVGYLYDSGTITTFGHIRPDLLVEDQAYIVFPVIPLLVSTIGHITSLDLRMSYFSLYSFHLILLAIITYLLLLRLAQRKGMGLLCVVVAAMTLYANPPHYLLWASITHRVLVITYTFLLLLICFKGRSLGSVIAVSLLSLVGAIQLGPVVFFLILAIWLILRRTNSFEYESVAQLFNSNKWLIRIPLLVFVFYQSFYALQALLMRLSNLFISVSELSRLPLVFFESSSLEHPLPILNAAGPGFVAGAVASLTFYSLYGLIRKNKTSNIQLLSSALAILSSTTMVFAGYLYRYQIGGNLASYFTVISFSLGVLVSGTLVLRFLPLIKTKGFSTAKLLITIYLILLFIGGIGGILDPYAFGIEERVIP